MDVSRETDAALSVYLSELARWQKRINLVAPSTIADARTRHIEDSLQLLDLAPNGPLTWVDLGSGGGFPGLVMAIALKERPGSRVHLVESNGKKCAFLRHVARETGAPATVHTVRIEAFMAEGAVPQADVVSARALAALPELVRMSAPLLALGARGLFMKGATAEDEMRATRLPDGLAMRLAPSRTEAGAGVVVIDAPSRIGHDGAATIQA